MPRVLHTLSQRPGLTGSGVTLDALVRHAASAGWEQEVVVGVPAAGGAPDVGGLDPAGVHPLEFGTGDLPFPVPGMSDVMPYPSTRFSAMTAAEMALYRSVWAAHLRTVLERFRPDLIHAHHVWILGSMLKDLAPDVPVVTHCHATGFRQMDLCPSLAGPVRAGCARNERFAVLHQDHADELVRRLQVDGRRVHVVGAGYREDLFHDAGRDGGGGNLIYIGKYSAAKGLPWLLDAVDRLADDSPGTVLHVAGSGAGEEADRLRARMERMSGRVRLHGQLSQDRLARLMRRCHVCVLPSFYEGVPLVLVEALACGCRLVATRLPGIVNEIAPHVGEALDLVDLPRLETVDRPKEEDLPAFVDRLTATLESALNKPPPDRPTGLERFTWEAVFHRAERIWKELVQ